MKSRLQPTTRLQCPECRMELLPADFSGERTHVTCGRCGREIFLDSSRYERSECPKCGKITESSDKSAEKEVCCP
jgi:DNA-directed RNA polymerase subunit RPC12/RpoP